MKNDRRGFFFKKLNMKHKCFMRKKNYIKILFLLFTHIHTHT